MTQWLSQSMSTCLLACCRKINKSPNTVDDPSILKIHLTKPPVKRIDLHFPLGMEVTARNLKGVTIKDAMDAIHKAYKKRVSYHLKHAHSGISRIYHDTDITLPHSPMMSSTTHTWLASSGIRKSPGRGWLFTCKRKPEPPDLVAAVARRRRRTRTKSNRLSRTLLTICSTSSFSFFLLVWLRLFIASRRLDLCDRTLWAGFC